MLENVTKSKQNKFVGYTNFFKLKQTNEGLSAIQNRGKQYGTPNDYAV